MKLYINGTFVGNYTEKCDCSIGYTPYISFKIGAYEVIVNAHDIDTVISDNHGTAVFTKKP